MSFHSGFVCILGRPNAGKSTLLNSLVGERLAIISPKPQTTRNRIQGIVHLPKQKGKTSGQVILIDTPGVHKPDSSLGRKMMAEVREARKSLTLGPWVLPLESGAVRSLRRGISFWELLSQRDVPATITRMPTNFPPVEFSGQSLVGMGTPDMQGGFGTFTYFTSDPDIKARQVPGGNIVSVRMENRRAMLPLEGPVNSFRKTRPKTVALLTVDTDPGSDAARIVVGSDTLVLKKGEWSPWIRVEFPLLGAAKHASGIFRVLLRSVTPFLAVYASPVNIDPSRPELPLSTPESYSRTLAEALGPFYTQGIAEDTAAVRTKVLSHEQFLEQA